MKNKEILNYFPKGLVLISSILLLILIPIFERKTYGKTKQILNLGERIGNEKINITWDSIQKIKIQINDHFQKITNLDSKTKNYFHNAMTKILLNNLGCASKRKVSIKEFSTKSHKEILNEIEFWIKNNREDVNNLVKQKKKFEKELSKLEKQKFFIYMLLVSLQSIGLIFNQFT